jgi:hypothetical protein
MAAAGNPRDERLLQQAGKAFDDLRWRDLGARNNRAGRPSAEGAGRSPLSGTG